MEHMADEVTKCLETASFGGKPLVCSRKIKSRVSTYLMLTAFLSLSQEDKQNCDSHYEVRKCDLLTELHHLWGVQLDFETISMTTNR